MKKLHIVIKQWLKNSKYNKIDNMKNKYISLGIVFGAGIGLCIGVLTNNIAIGTSLGAGVGLVFGALFKKYKK